MIRFACAEDAEKIRALWELCFPDDSGFNDYFFDKLFCVNHVLLFEEDHVIQAMLQMIPLELCVSSEETEKCTYIYGACTHPAHRRKHLMSRLLEYSFMLDRSQGVSASVLIPAEPWLFDFYRLFDYQPVFRLDTKEIEAADRRNELLYSLDRNNVEQMQHLYKEFLSARGPYISRTNEYWIDQIGMFTELGMGCFGAFNAEGVLDGYAFSWKPEGNTVYVQEVIARTPEIRQKLLFGIAAQANATIVRYSEYSSCAQPFGCMKRYYNQSISHAYMNLMMN